VKHECGVFGAYNCEQASNITYLGLTSIQHRGQEGAGICSCSDEKYFVYKGKGLVTDVFSHEDIGRLSGKLAIGHVRYSTTGESNHKNLQPFLFEYALGKMALVHNGNLIGSKKLRDFLISEGAIFGTTSDTEIITHLIARSKKDDVKSRIIDALKDIKGAFSLVFMTGDSMIAVRDPWGIRPLMLARLPQKNGDGYIVCSETSPLKLIGAKYVRDIEPGELLEIRESGLKSRKIFKGRFKNSSCVFELIYFARPDSKVFGESVYDFRIKLGEILAEKSNVKADLVSPIPDSGSVAAIGFSRASAVPFDLSLIRNHYVGRTFIEPEGEIRRFGVKIKLHPVEHLIKDKSVVLVDDSLVRGTTSKKIIGEVRECGAREVHLMITSPPFKYPCYYGIDTPTKEELVAHSIDIEGIRKLIGADSLTYLTVEDLKKARQGSEEFCFACFDGDYAV